MSKKIIICRKIVEICKKKKKYVEKCSKLAKNVEK